MKFIISIMLIFSINLQAMATSWVEIRKVTQPNGSFYKRVYDLYYCEDVVDECSNDNSCKEECTKSHIVTNLEQYSIDNIKRRTNKTIVWVAGVVAMRYAITIILFWTKLIEGFFTFVKWLFFSGAVVVSLSGGGDEPQPTSREKLEFETREEFEDWVLKGRVVVDEGKPLSDKELRQLRDALKTKEDCEDFEFFQRMGNQINPVALIKNGKAWRKFREQAEEELTRKQGNKPGQSHIHIMHSLDGVEPWVFFQRIEKHVKNFLYSDELGIGYSKCHDFKEKG